MDASATLIAHLCLSGLSVAAAVVAVWYAQKSRELSASDTVDELTRTVAKVLTAQRTEQMRRVRAGARDPVPGGPLLGPEAPPELRQVGGTDVAGSAEYKASLRRRMSK